MVINETNLIISPRKKEREFVTPSLCKIKKKKKQ